MDSIQAVKNILSRSDERTQYVLERRTDGLTYAEIAMETGVSRERIRQILCKAKRKIYQEMKREGLLDRSA